MLIIDLVHVKSGPKAKCHKLSILSKILHAFAQIPDFTDTNHNV